MTIDYHDGRPLGMLLGAIDGATSRRRQRFADPFAIGLGTTIKPDASGTLYLRVNDSAGQLDDNRGTLTVTIEAVRAECTLAVDTLADASEQWRSRFARLSIRLDRLRLDTRRHLNNADP